MYQLSKVTFMDPYHRVKNIFNNHACKRDFNVLYHFEISISHPSFWIIYILKYKKKYEKFLCLFITSLEQGYISI